MKKRTRPTTSSRCRSRWSAIGCGSCWPTAWRGGNIRYLNQLFRRDQHVQFDELLFFPRLHGTGKLAERPEFPRDVEGWARYDVVILGDVTPQQLPAESQQALVEFVRTRGGNVIVVAGPQRHAGRISGQPLMELLPVEPAKNVFPQQGYSLRLTEEGRFQSALLIADSPQDSRATWRSDLRAVPGVTSCRTTASRSRRPGR